jgi:hypothetical protein
MSTFPPEIRSNIFASFFAHNPEPPNGPVSISLQFSSGTLRAITLKIVLEVVELDGASDPRTPSVENLDVVRAVQVILIKNTEPSWRSPCTTLLSLLKCKPFIRMALEVLILPNI